MDDPGSTRKFIDEKVSEDEKKFIYRNAKGNVIFTPIYKQYSKVFFKEVVKNTSIKTDFEAFRDTSVYERYISNFFQFSAAKAAAEAKTLQSEVFDDDGVVKSYHQFRNDANDIADIYQQQWLRVEYDTCKRSTIMGEQFRQMTEDKDLYPYWVYRGVMDDREREEHVEMEGKVFRIGDTEGDECFPPNDWNCRCEGEPVDDDYLDSKNLSVTTNAQAKELADDNVDDQFRYNPGVQGMLPKKGSYFDVVDNANELDYKDFDLPKASTHPSQWQDEIDDLTPEQKKQYDDFERDPDLTGEDAILQERSILKVVTDKEGLVDDYLSENENVINTDNARPLFKDLGYNGTNAAAVHEASSVVAKDAYKRLLADGKNDHVSFYAGGSGSGKTSSIENIFKGIREKSDAIMDGNLSNFAKAFKQINSLLTEGKSVDIIYVYRTPAEAWEGVIHRMLNNPKEMGLLVPMSTFLKNTEGSYRTIESMFKEKIDQLPMVNINIVDNSLGRNNAAIMDREKFDSITFPKDLENQIKGITKKYYDEGKITAEQFNALNQ